MNRKCRRFAEQLKAVLCLALVMNLMLWTGGCDVMNLSALAGTIRIDLTPDHPLAELLQGSNFENATAIEINQATQEFRLIFPDDAQEFRGTFANSPRGPEVTQLTLTDSGQSVSLEMDASRSVTSITTSNGFQWDRPAAWETPIATGGDEQTYLDANISLLEAADELEQQGVVAPADTPFDSSQPADAPVPVKANPATLGPVMIVLSVLAVIWGGDPLGINGVLAWLFRVMEILF